MSDLENSAPMRLASTAWIEAVNAPLRRCPTLPIAPQKMKWLCFSNIAPTHLLATVQTNIPTI